MNMVDVKKVHRGVLFWREDVIKCEKCLKTPLSRFVRNILHRELEKYELPEEGKTMLQKQIEMAYVARCKNHPNARKKKLTVDIAEIPADVRKNPRFVRSK